jgi:hypothetical protein
MDAFTSLARDVSSVPAGVCVFVNEIGLAGSAKQRTDVATTAAIAEAYLMMISQRLTDTLNARHKSPRISRTQAHPTLCMAYKRLPSAESLDDVRKEINVRPFSRFG